MPLLRREEELQQTSGVGNGRWFWYRAVAVTFGAAGAWVISSDIHDANGLATVAQIEEVGGVARYVRCDVADPRQHAAAVAEAAYGRLDRAINNAGIGGTYARLLDQTPHDWNQMMAVNLGSVF